MNEETYISQIESSLRTAGQTSLQLISLVSSAVRDFPRSARLWFLHGQAIAAAEDPFRCTHRIALESFKRCLDLDASFSAARSEMENLLHHPARP